MQTTATPAALTVKTTVAGPDGVAARPAVAAGTAARRRARRRTFACALAAWAAGHFATAVAADDFTGLVTGVPSGDTLQVADGARTVEVRLADIGAPHGSDFYAPAARALLSAMVEGRTVKVTVTGRSGPDRVFGRVFSGVLDVNLELVRRGAAWMCIEYATDTDYLPFQRNAQREQLGLWASANTNDFDARNRCRQRPPAEHPVGRS